MPVNPISHILYLSLCTTIVACGSADKDDSSEIETDEIYSLNIVSPASDASYASGELVGLSVAVESNSGTIATLDQVIWETGDWTASGNNLNVSDLPDGSRSLSVTVASMGETFSGAVDIHIGDNYFIIVII